MFFMRPEEKVNAHRTLDFISGWDFITLLHLYIANSCLLLCECSQSSYIEPLKCNINSEDLILFIQLK